MKNIEYIMNGDDGNPARFSFNYDTDDDLEALLSTELHRLLSIKEMAHCAIDELTDEERDDMRDMSRDELIMLHNSVGRDIRNAFGLWIAGNPQVSNHPDDTSMLVLKLIWVLVQNASSGGSQAMTFK